MQPKNIISFPPCLAHSTSFRTFVLKNVGEIPMPYEFERLTGQSAFNCKPSQGMIQPNSAEIITVQFLPTENKIYDLQIKCFLNHSLSNLIVLNLYGVAQLPSLSIENDGKIFFKPTVINGNSIRSFLLENPSRIPVLYEWELPNNMKEIFPLKKQKGILRGLETEQIVWNFVPRKQIRYVQKVPCKFSSVDIPLPQDKQVQGEQNRYTPYLFILFLF